MESESQNSQHVGSSTLKPIHEQPIQEVVDDITDSNILEMKSDELPALDTTQQVTRSNVESLSSSIHVSHSDPSLNFHLQANSPSGGENKTPSTEHVRSAPVSAKPRDEDGFSDSWVREQRIAHGKEVKRKQMAIDRLKVLAETQRKREEDLYLKQTNSVRKMRDRMETWVEIAKNLRRNVVKRNQHINSLVNTNFPSIVLSNPELEAKWEETAQESMGKLQKSIFERLDGHIKELEGISKRLGGNMNAALKELSANNNSLKERWEDYYLQYGEYMREFEHGRFQKTDPTLTGRKYEITLQKYRLEEKTFSLSLLRLLDEFKIIDGRRVEAIQTMALEYLESEKEILSTLEKITEECIQNVKDTNPDEEVEKFLQFAEVYTTRGDEKQDQAAAPTTTVPVFEIQNPTQEDFEIQENINAVVDIQGTLQRPGQIVKSNWKPVYVVLSVCGMLYQFENAAALEPASSVRLNGEVKVKQATDIDPLAFCLIVPDVSFFAFSNHPIQHVFKAKDKEELKKWMTLITKHLKDNTD